MSTLKITRHENVKVDVTVDAAELAEKFTDAQLAEVGLFRSLRDADIERENILIRQSWIESTRCDDDDCQCVLHDGRPSVAAQLQNRVPAATRQDTEASFWHDVRTLILRRDFNGFAREIEARAWNHGGVSVLLTDATKDA
jgi:hypothetical protein